MTATQPSPHHSSADPLRSTPPAARLPALPALRPTPATFVPALPPAPCAVLPLIPPSRSRRVTARASSAPDAVAPPACVLFPLAAPAVPRRPAPASTPRRPRSARYIVPVQPTAPRQP